MIENPLIHNDEYTHGQDRQKKMIESDSKRSISVTHRSLLNKRVNQTISSSSELPGRFRFMDTKQERIARQLYLNEILDAVPNRNIDQTFNREIRQR